MNKIIPLCMIILILQGCSVFSEKKQTDEISQINQEIQEKPTAAGQRDRNKIPRAKIIVARTQGVAPFSTTFDGSDSSDRDGIISQYNWDFGDGNIGSGAIINHQYNTAGDYTVTLTVTDDKGAVRSVTSEINVIIAQESTPLGTRPVGIYSKDRVQDLPFVSGVAFRMFWSEIEPEQGVYDFSKIDQIVHDAEFAGQHITFSTMLLEEPYWLKQGIPDSEKYQGMQGIDIVPWNETMLVAVENLAEALSNYEVDGIPLKDHPVVRQVNAPIGTMNSIRMKSIPKGYTPELFKEGVMRSIRAWAYAFPDKHLFVGLFGVNDGIYTTSRTVSATTLELRDNLLAEFNGIENPRINFFIEYWTGQNPAITNETLYHIKDDTSIMMQACGAWDGQKSNWAHCNWVDPEDTPELGFNFAMDNFNATYFEVYEADLYNTEYTRQFEEAAIKIQQLADSLD